LYPNAYFDFLAVEILGATWLKLIFPIINETFLMYFLKGNTIVELFLNNKILENINLKLKNYPYVKNWLENILLNNIW